MNNILNLSLTPPACAATHIAAGGIANAAYVLGLHCANHGIDLKIDDGQFKAIASQLASYASHGQKFWFWLD